MLRFIDCPSVKNESYICNVNKADSRYVAFQTTGPKGAVLHSVGVAKSSGKAFADYFNQGGLEASVHAVLQPDGTVYQLAPWNYRMWHVGGSANNTHVGIEMVEPDTDAIYYDSSYRLHIVDEVKALAFVRKTYAVAVELFALLCKQYGWNPLEDGVIISHSEAYKRGLGSGHADPEHLWNLLPCGFTMDTFRADVKKELEKGMDKQEIKRVALNEGRFAAKEAIKQLMTIDGGDKHSDYAAEAIAWAKENGIVVGTSDGDYGWQKPITRQDVVCMLYRFAQLMRG